MFSKFKIIILSGLFLVSTNIFAQNIELVAPVEQELSFNLGVWGYYTFSGLETIEEKINFKPLASFTYKNRYEVGLSYLKFSKTVDGDYFSPDITFTDDNTFFGYYGKYYAGKKNEISIQIGYNKLSHNYEGYDYLTGLYSETIDDVTSLYEANKKTKFDLYTSQTWVSFSAGYSFNIAPQFYLEPQLAYHNVKEETIRYRSMVTNTADLSAHPDNHYSISDPRTTTYNRFQINLIATYRFTAIKKKPSIPANN